MQNQYEDKFLGPKRIKIVQDTGKTAGHVDLLKITFDDGTSESYSALMLAAENVVTPQPTDATALQVARLYPVVNKILEVCRDYILKMSEFNHLTALIIASVNNNFDRADQFLWKTEYLTERTMNDLEEVMKQIPTLNDVISGSNN